MFTRTLHHDRMLRLRGIETTNAAGTVLSRHGYTLDDAGRRQTATRENGQRWDYGYDSLGQVTTAEKKFPDESSIPGHAFAYAYDGIGNRTTATQGGANTGVTYSTNPANQHTAIETQGGRYLFGEATVNSAVTINGNAASRAGGLGFYWRQLSADNSQGPLWSEDRIESHSETVSGRSWTPAASVSPIYDEDGNLLFDGRWHYTWNAENRLIEMTATSAAMTTETASGIPSQRLRFVYDSQGRRISKTVESTLNGGNSWSFVSNRRYLYDGWNLISEYSTPTIPSDLYINDLRLEAGYTWGIDLSGSAQGAGGVGGLLSVTFFQQHFATYYPAYDGNGNISAWIDPSGELVAKMDYSPFGQLINEYNLSNDADLLSKLNFGFSTKYTDEETGLCYYGYRYYDPVTGRWPSRDPIQEKGGVNLYGFVNNSGINEIDKLGLYTIQDAVARLKQRNVEPQGTRNPLDGPLSDNEYSDEQKFEEWIKLEMGDVAWLGLIPKCPSCITVENETPKDCTNGKWHGIKKATRFHPGAEWCMRSKPVGGSAQQCCYDAQGLLMKELPAAGSPDRVAADFAGTITLGHVGHDVETYNLASALNKVGRTGEDTGTYAEVRPPSKGGGKCYE